MRHRNAGRKLSRNSEHRQAMLRNMARSLLTFGSIRTTEAKARELSRFADRLITLSLRDDLHSRRLAYKVLANHQLVAKLFGEIGPAFAGVPGGFTRVVKLGLPRAGDAAPMAVIELTRKAAEAAAPEAAEEKPKAKKAVKAETKAEPEAKPKPRAKKPKTEAAPEEAKSEE